MQVVASTAVLALPATYEAFETNDFEAEIERALATHAEAVVVDCEPMVLPSSVVIASLLKAYQTCQHQRVSLFLCRASDGFQRVLSSLWADRILSHCPDCRLQELEQLCWRTAD